LPSGKIIDPHFKEYDELVKRHGVENCKAYVPASKVIQELILTRLTMWMLQECGRYECFEDIPLKYEHCAMNAYALMKTKYPEATYTVGSMGFGAMHTGIMWYFGNPTWNKYHQFITCDGTQKPASRYGANRNWIKGGLIKAEMLEGKVEVCGDNAVAV